MSGRPRLSSAARSAIRGAAAAADRVAPPPLGITILIYHRVGAGQGGQMDLDPTAFDAQLRWLAEHRRVLTLDAAVDELAASGEERAAASGEDPVRPGVVLTFDDGTTDWVHNVLPALERHDVPATFYVATSFVDERITFPGGGEPLDWAGVGELAASPLVTIGSHTHRHLLLDRLDPAEVADELDRSIDLLGDRVGVVPEHFAYPKALAGSPAADAEVRQRFGSAVLAGTRPNAAGADLHRLHRSPVLASDTMAWFRRKADGGMHLEDDLRQQLNRVRYRNLDT